MQWCSRPSYTKSSYLQHSISISLSWQPEAACEPQQTSRVLTCCRTPEMLLPVHTAPVEQSMMLHCAVSELKAAKQY